MSIKVISLRQSSVVLMWGLCASFAVRAQHCVPFVNHTSDNVSVIVDVLGDIAQVPLGSGVGLDEITMHNSGTLVPGALWGVTVNFEDINMKTAKGPLRDFTLSIGDRTIDVSELEKINQAYRAIKDEGSCEDGGPLERFAVALFDDQVGEDTAGLHDQGALIRRWYKILLDSSGVTMAAPQAKKSRGIRGWFKGKEELRAFSGDIESAVSTAQQKAAQVSQKGTESELNRAVVNQTTALFMADDMFNEVDQSGVEQWQKVGKELLSYIAQKASHDEFFAVYWPLFYGFKLSVQAFKHAIEARGGNDEQAHTLAQNKGLFGTYRTQLQKMIAWHASLSKLSQLQALAVLVASYLDTNLMRQEKQLSSFLSGPMKKYDPDAEWVQTEEEPDFIIVDDHN